MGRLSAGSRHRVMGADVGIFSQTSGRRRHPESGSRRLMRIHTWTEPLRFHSAVLSFILAIGWATANSAEPKVINIGWTGGSSWTALPDRIATERGFFEKEGLKVRYIQFQGTNLMLSALWPKNLDNSPTLPSIAGAAPRGCPVTMAGPRTTSR